MERVAGIEPAPSAWKAEVLPLNHTRNAMQFQQSTKLNNIYIKFSWYKMVVGEGFEPSKLSRQIYSLMGLTAPQPHLGYN